jgi:hypothetical protein
MADRDHGAEAMAAVRAALVADAGVAALVGGRVVDEPAETIAFPYIRFGRVEIARDDTDGATGVIVQMGLTVHSRPVAGRIEAGNICAKIATALHRGAASVSLLGLWDVEVQTWFVERASDGASYLGRLALQMRLDDPAA